MKRNWRALLALAGLTTIAPGTIMAAAPWDGVFTGIEGSFTTGGAINTGLFVVAIAMMAWGIMQGQHGEDSEPVRGVR